MSTELTRPPMSRPLKLARVWLQALLTPVPLAGMRHLPGYVRDYLRFRRAGPLLPMGLLDSYPCLGDRTAKTPFDPHYFFQGAWLARRVARQMPAQHIDVGSSALTMSVLSGFVPTRFVDVRPLAVDLAGFEMMEGDVNHLPFDDGSIDSLSCLHVIEHVGLGRYGDALDPHGHERAAQELARVLAPGGCLYLSAPVGRERVCFNGHRVFAAETIGRMFGALETVEFSFVGDDRKLHERQQLAEATGLDYGCGLFIFRKPSQSIERA